MMFLPIVERELRAASRLTATYRNRVIVAGIVTFASIIILMFGAFAPLPSSVGRPMFRVASYLTLLFCLLEGVRKTADCISEEKREGTLGLLFLTDLKGHDVVLGKLAATSLNSFYGLLAILPALALPLLLGGVTPGEYWRMALALLNILFFSLCAGMLVSAKSDSEQQAMGRTVLLIALVVAIPLLTWTHVIMPLSPVYAFHSAFDANYAPNAAGYWRSLWITLGLSWLLLLSASFAARRGWRDDGDNTPAPEIEPAQRLFEDSVLRSRAKMRTEMLDINPAYWLAGRNVGRQTPVFLKGIVILALVGTFFMVTNPDFTPVFVGTAVVLNLMLKMRVAAQACHCLAEARQNNALEILLATPLRVDELISGQIQAIKKIFLTPIIIILSIEIGGLMLGTIARGVGPSDVASAIFVLPIYLCVFALDMAAVTWAGMWFGLSSKKESQAVTKTILFVLILPFSSFILSCFGIVLFIAYPIFWIMGANLKLHSELRSMAAQRYDGRANATWLPGTGMGGADAPPVISSIAK